MTINIRNGDWMQTFSGRKFWPLDPYPEDIHIEDIAHGLSMVCRFAGHCRVFYSVAQHSVLVAQALAPEHRLWGLLHDASEAYIGDMIRPLKRSMPEYRAVEDRIMRAVADRFNLVMPIPKEIKRIDNAILADEMEQIMAPSPEPWLLPEPPLGITIRPWGPEEGRREFLQCFSVKR